MTTARTAEAYATGRRAAAPGRPGPAHGGDAGLRRRREEADIDAYEERMGLGRAPGSLPVRLLVAALANPVLTGGVLISLVASVAIVSNAVGGQTKRHPSPLFQTRPFTAPAAPAARTAPQRSGSSAQPAAAAQPVSAGHGGDGSPAATTREAQSVGAGAADPVSTAALPRSKPKASDPAQAVRDLQVLLKAHGTYQGPVDGIPGTGTADAIRALEKRLGLPVTGEASDRLVAAAEAAAQPQPRPLGSGTIAVRTTTITPPAPLGRSAGPEPLAAGGSPKLQRVQRNLLAAGYGPMRTDGKMDERTQEAIRRYELDRGWTVTGKLSDRLVLDAMTTAGGAR